MTAETILLALLVFAMVATRPLEERRWRAGRISDRTTTLLVLGRLPVLIGGFALITGRPLPVLVGMTLIAVLVAAVLYPLVLGRVRRAGRGT